jgi:hypothetical protein
VPADFPSEITRFLLRELAALRRELEAYPEDGLVWSLPPGAPNSAGTLALHLSGHIQHYVGAVLGGTSYLRDRDAEFATRGLPRRDLLANMAEAERAVVAVLPGIANSSLNGVFPERLRGVKVTTREALLQVATHAAYHVGQVDYHRRLVTGDSAGVDAVSPVLLSAQT